jgi:tetratricopeptide (TPR) repeat protein
MVAAYPQESAENSDSTSQGIALYERGETEAAIKVLRETVKISKDKPRAWHYLGLALAKQGNSKEAIEAFGKAIDLRSRTMSLGVSRTEEWHGDQLASFKTLLAEQIESLSKLSEILTDNEARGKAQLVLERSRGWAECVEQNTKLVGGQPVVTKSDLKLERARVLSKPEPRYTSEARQAKISGTVVLKAVFAGDGSIKYIEPIRSLRYGLTEESVRAASLIKFTPESICGKPVSSPIQLEYNFWTGR